jgi:hypothetical protein
MAILVAGGVSAAADRLGVDVSAEPLGAWALAYHPTPRERFYLSCYLGRRRSYARRAAGALVAIPNNRDRVAYARSLVAPDPEAVHTPVVEKVRRAALALLMRRDAPTS